MDSSRPGNKGGPAMAPDAAGVCPAATPGTAILDSVPESIAVLDRHGVITHVNRAWRRLAAQTGASMADGAGVGTNYLELMQQAGAAEAETAAQFSQGIQQVMAGELREFTLEYPSCSPGQEGWFLFQVNRLEDPSTGTVVVSHRDITERKLLEAQFRHAQRQALLGRLASGVAHDFNNFLTVILGYNELLLTTPGLDPGLRDSLTEVKNAGEKAARLAGQLLVFSRHQRLESTVLDINEVVIDSEKMFKRLLGETVKLVTRLGADAGLVRVGAGQLEQVLMNLAVNARDAMPAGGELTIETERLEVAAVGEFPGVGFKSASRVVLTVSDTGTGMDAATQARIFEPFFTTKEPGKGTGLGLAMVSGFIQQSGGHIAVSSAPGAGSTFKIYLPREDAAALAEAGRSEPQVFNAA